MRKFIIGILVCLFFGGLGCFNAVGTYSDMKAQALMTELLSRQPVTSDSAVLCGYTKMDAHKSHYSTWKDSIDVRYYIEYSKIYDKAGNEIVDYFNKSDKKYIKENTEIASQRWAVHMKKPVFEVGSKEAANLIVYFGFLQSDGKGGYNAIGDFPPAKGDLRKPLVRIDMADMWQNVKDREKAKNGDTYYSVVLHEFGHSLGALKHDDEFSIMNPNNRYNVLQIDDVVGVRVTYKNFENFTFQGITYTYINSKTPEKMVTKNFSMKELKSRCTYGRYPAGNFIALNTVLGIQFLRDFYGCPISILSNYRDIQCNDIAGGATYSQHIFRNALDFKFIGKNGAKIQDRFFNDIILKSMVLKKLAELKIRSFGSYAYGHGTNHMDCRQIPINKGNGKAYGVDIITWGEFKGGNAHGSGNDYKRYD
jgi:hypothetical protein